MVTPRENTWIILARSFGRFFRTSSRSLGALLFARDLPKENFPTLNRIFFEGPSDFEKKPTAIRAGRAIFTFLLSFFHYVPEKK